MPAKPSQTNKQPSLTTASIVHASCTCKASKAWVPTWVPRCHEQHCMVANCTLMHALVHLRCGCDTQKRQMRSILHLSPAQVRFRCHTGCRQKKPATRSTRHSCKTQTQAQRSNVSKSTRYACYWLQMIVVWSARAEGGDEIAGRLARAHCCAIRPRFTARRMQ